MFDKKKVFKPVQYGNKKLEQFLEETESGEDKPEEDMMDAGQVAKLYLQRDKIKLATKRIWELTKEGTDLSVIFSAQKILDNKKEGLGDEFGSWLADIYLDNLGGGY